MSTSPHVVILAGGLSHERDVSIRSGRRVAEALRAAGHTVDVLDVDANLIPTLSASQPDLVWPLLHGASGEDGSLRDILELLDLNYLGTRPRESRIGWNKPVAKSVLSAAGISTPQYVTLPQSLFRELGAQSVMGAVVSKLGLPLVVKPARGGSALGVTLVKDASALPQALVDCFAYSELALIERAVSGTEVAVSVIDTPSGIEALPPVEIVTDGPYDYDARYNPGRTQYFTPARLSADLIAEVQSTAITAHKALGLRHISRTDMIIGEDGTIWFLEVNVAPGMTETSLLPQSVVATGSSLAAVYSGWVEAVLADTPAPEFESSVSAVPVLDSDATGPDSTPASKSPEFPLSDAEANVISDSVGESITDSDPEPPVSSLDGDPVTPTQGATSTTESVTPAEQPDDIFAASNESDPTAHMHGNELF